MLFIFDLDDTLYDTRAPFRQLLENNHLLHDYAFDDIFKKYATCSQQAFERFASGDITLTQSHILRLKNFLNFYRIDKSDTELLALQKQYETLQGQISLPTTVQRLLTKLEHQQLAILTNGPTVGQTRKLNSLQIQSYIPQTYWFISQTIGFAKPDTRAFNVVLKEFSIDRKQAWMVGDSHANDIVPAAQLGCNTIWINRNDKSISPIATKTVYSQEELTNYILRLIKKSECI